MSGSTTAIVAIVVVAAVALVIWLIAVRYAATHPAHRKRRKEQMHGVVQGGQHVGGGRSVAPTRDAPVPEGGGTPPSPEAPDTEDREAGEAPQRSRNPMDL